MNKPFDKLRNPDPAALPAVSARRIGNNLLDAGKITAPDAERALRLQREKGLRFGEACIKLGLVTQADIDEVLSGQFKYPICNPARATSVRSWLPRIRRSALRSRLCARCVRSW
jgi:hypothetical protein